MRHALVNASGEVMNVVVWDGESDWGPPEGMTVVQDKLAEATIGGFFDGKAFAPAPVIEPTLPQLTDRALIEVLQAELAVVKEKLEKLTIPGIAGD